MTKTWPLVQMRELLRHRKSFFTLDDSQDYLRPKVRLHAQGIVIRDRICGAKISTKKQQICHASDFLVAEIDAKMGGFGIVPAELDGAIVSSHYFLFEANQERLLPSYLNYFCTTKEFQNQVAAKGTTNYAAIRASHVLEYVMPLPTIDEQRRIVTRISTVQKHLEEIVRLRLSIERNVTSLLAVRFEQTLGQADWLPLREVAPLVRRNVQLVPNRMYKALGARSFGKGLFVKGDFESDSATWERPVWIKSGDLVFSNIKAWEGAIAVAKAEHEGFIASHRYLTAVVRAEMVIPEYLLYYLLTDAGLAAVNEASPGTADRNRTTKQAALTAIRVPIPPISIQRKFVDLKNALELSAVVIENQRLLLGAVLPAICHKTLCPGL